MTPEPFAARASEPTSDIDPGSSLRASVEPAAPAPDAALPAIPALPEASRLAAALAGGAPVLVLSAHLDDAVLSCGALLRALAGRCPLTVATVFTEATAPPHTRAARSFLRQCAVPGRVAAGPPTAQELFAARRAEDIHVVERVGARPVHLGAVDALFRHRALPGPLDLLGKALPEAVHRYPTYRFDIALGRVSGGDDRLVDGLREQVDELVSRTGATVLLCPIGIGRHVDHLITRSLGEGRADAVYYSDFPYDLRSAADPRFVRTHRLHPWTYDDGIAAKEPLIRAYGTQADALFPDGVIPARPERYWEPAAP